MYCYRTPQRVTVSGIVKIAEILAENNIKASSFLKYEASSRVLVNVRVDNEMKGLKDDMKFRHFQRKFPRNWAVTEG